MASGTGDDGARHIVFVGQLPYSADKAAVEAHFRAGGCGAQDGPLRVRLLTDASTQRSRGMAFVELGSRVDERAALALDFSVLGGRRIRVERTVRGGGHGGARRDRLKRIRERDSKRRRDDVDGQLKSTFEAARRPSVTEADFDDRVRDFLYTCSSAAVERALAELKEVDVSRVRHVRRYVMGVLKRLVAEEDSTRGGKAGAKRQREGADGGMRGRRRQRSLVAEGGGAGRKEAVGKPGGDDGDAQNGLEDVITALNYEDGNWYRAEMVKDLSEGKLQMRLYPSGRLQDTLQEDVGSRRQSAASARGRSRAATETRRSE